MKRERDSFFESSNFNMSATGQMPAMNGMNMGMPNVNAGGSNFYASQNMPMPLPIYPNTNNTVSSSTITELESKIAKLERSINRLDARVSKLEGTQFYTQDTYDVENNMYMV